MLRSVFTGWYADKELTTKISDIKMIGNKTGLRRLEGSRHAGYAQWR